jgi:hypothetical protein
VRVVGIARTGLFVAFVAAQSGSSVLMPPMSYDGLSVRHPALCEVTFDKWELLGRSLPQRQNSMGCP